MPSVPRLMIISLITTRDCHSAEEKQTILPIEKVFTMRTAAIDGVGQHRLLLGNVCGTRVEYTCGGEGCLGN